MELRVLVPGRVQRPAGYRDGTGFFGKGNWIQLRSNMVEGVETITDIRTDQAHLCSLLLGDPTYFVHCASLLAIPESIASPVRSSVVWWGVVWEEKAQSQNRTVIK